MRRQFREWYAPTEDELKLLWTKGTFVLDSNVLLGLYQYPPTTLDEFLKVLETIKARLWLPHKSGEEYHRNRDKSLPHQRAIIEKLIKTIEELSGHLETLGLPEYHPVLDLVAVESARTVTKGAFEKLLEPFRLALQDTPRFSASAVFEGEPVRDRITNLFDGRVGDPLTPAELQKTYSGRKPTLKVRNDMREKYRPATRIDPRMSPVATPIS